MKTRGLRLIHRYQRNLVPSLSNSASIVVTYRRWRFVQTLQIPNLVPSWVAEFEFAFESRDLFEV